MNPKNALPEYMRRLAQQDTHPLATPAPWLLGIDGLDHQPRPQRPSGERAGNKPPAYFYSQRIALIGVHEQIIMQRRRQRLKMARRREIAESAIWALAILVLVSEVALLWTLIFTLLIH